MEGLALFMSILVLVALIIISIIVFINMYHMSKAMKELESHHDNLRSRQSDSENILDTDIQTLNANIMTTSSNLGLINTRLSSTSSNISQELAKLNKTVVDNDMYIRVAASNGVNILAAANKKLATDILKMSSNVAKEYVKNTDLNNLSAPYPLLTGERVIIGSQYSLSNVGGSFAVVNSAGQNMMTITPGGDRAANFLGPVSSQGNITTQNNICIQQSCMTKAVFDKLINASKTMP